VHINHLALTYNIFAIKNRAHFVCHEILAISEWWRMIYRLHLMQCVKLFDISPLSGKILHLERDMLYFFMCPRTETGSILARKLSPPVHDSRRYLSICKLIVYSSGLIGSILCRSRGTERSVCCGNLTEPPETPLIVLYLRHLIGRKANRFLRTIWIW
jgi:hypothetical protein